MWAVNTIAKKYLRKNTATFALLVTLGVLNSVVSFLITIIIGAFFTLRFHENGSKNRLLEMLGIGLRSVNSFFVFFLALVVLKGIFSLAYHWLMSLYGEKFSRQIREQLFAAQITQPPDVFLRKNHGYYLLRYSGDLSAAKNYLTKGILGTVKQILFLCTGIILLACIHLQLTLCLVLSFCIILAISSSLTMLQKRTIKKSRDLRSSLLAYVSKKFNRYNNIKTGQLEQKTIGVFNTKSAELYEANRLNIKFESSIRALIPVLQYLMLAVLLYASVVLTPNIPYSDMLIFVLIVMLLMSDMRRIMNIPVVLNKGAISLEKINEVFSMHETNSVAVVPTPLKTA